MEERNLFENRGLSWSVLNVLKNLMLVRREKNCWSADEKAVEQFSFFMLQLSSHGAISCISNTPWSLPNLNITIKKNSDTWKNGQIEKNATGIDVLGHLTSSLSVKIVHYDVMEDKTFFCKQWKRNINQPLLIANKWRSNSQKSLPASLLHTSYQSQVYLNF